MKIIKVEEKCKGCGGIGRVQEYLYREIGFGGEWQPTGKWEDCHNCRGSGLESERERKREARRAEERIKKALGFNEVESDIEL